MSRIWTGTLVSVSLGLSIQAVKKSGETVLESSLEDPTAQQIGGTFDPFSDSSLDTIFVSQSVSTIPFANEAQSLGATTSAALDNELHSAIGTNSPVHIPRDNSLGIFGIALFLIGIAVTSAGLFSLSIQARIGEGDPKEILSQVQRLSFASATHNVSRNWRTKKEARWFVLMGISSIVLGLLGWLL